MEDAGLGEEVAVEGDRASVNDDGRRSTTDASATAKQMSGKLYVLRQVIVGKQNVARRESSRYVVVAEGWPSWLTMVGLLGKNPAKVYLKNTCYKKLFENMCHTRWYAWDGKIMSVVVTDAENVYASSGITMGLAWTGVCHNLVFALDVAKDGRTGA